jgi:pseudouridine synthase
MSLKKLMSEDKRVRLNKFIAAAGYASRRKIDELILEGRVSVNRKMVTELGTKVDPETDLIKVDGEIIKTKSRFIYILLNKPAGYITSTSDEMKRPTVMDLVKIKHRIYPVGRLDYDTEGLLILTNDGDLANKLMHPKFAIDKVYHVKVNRSIDENSIERLAEGIKIDGKKTAPAKIFIIPHTENKEFKITIHEGRNRQIRKMMEAAGYFIRKLRRIEYAELNIKGLKKGEWRNLTEYEIKQLKKIK